MKKSIKGVGKKVLASAVSAAMVVAFTPVVAWGADPVAEVNGTACGSLDAALSEAATIASTGQSVSIKLLNDITGTSNQYIGIAEGMTVSVDLNGKALVGINNGPFIQNAGNLTINDSSNGLGRLYTTNTDAQGRAAIANYGSLTINNGTFGDKNADRTDANDVQRGNAVRNYGTAIINGGFFTACDNYTNGGYAYAIANGGSEYPNATTTINNATVYGKMNGVLAADSGLLNVKGGSYSLGSGTETNLFYMVYTSGEGKATVEGGSFTRNVSNEYGFFFADDSSSAITVKGGSFEDQRGGQNIIAAGSAAISFNDGVFMNGISTKTESVSLDISGGTYADLSAIKYAKENATIALAKDVTITSATQVGDPVAISKSLTLDLNGHNITGNGTRVFNVKAGTLKLVGNGNVSSTKAGNDLFQSASTVIRVGDNEGETREAGLEIGQGVTVSSDYCYGVTVFGSKTKETVIVNGMIQVSGSQGALSGNGTAGYGGTNITINPGASITAQNDAAIYHPQSGTLTVNGGTIQGTTGIECKSGQTTIAISGNPTIESTNSEVFHLKNNNGTSTKGYAIAVVENSAYSGNASATIQSGVFTGPVSVVQDDEVDADKKGSITITGGTFSSDPTSYVPSGYVVSGSGPYTVGVYVPYVPETPITPPAEVGDKTESVEIPTTPGESGSTGSTKVDITVTDTTASTDSKGNKVDGSVSIDKIETTGTAVSIPEIITTDQGTFLVTSIPASAMADNTTVESVTIPESVTSIGENAFAGCTALTSVTVPAGVTAIEQGTFANCTNLTTVEVKGDVTSIAPSAFEGCSSLESVDIPATVTSIGEGAFAGCSSLTSTTIPAGVTTIEANTFSGCTNLTTVEVKGEVTEIAADAFNGCTNLTGLTTSGGLKPLAAASAATGKLVIPASVTKIGDRAFKGTGITSVTIPAGVKMGTGVFRDCKQLTKAAVAKGVKTLSSYTFKGCSALKSVSIPSTMTKVERSAFSGCKNLAKVTLPKSVTSIGKNALYGASKAKTLTVNSKKLTKSSVKGSLAGSKVTTVKVPKSKMAAYKKIFTKSNCGKTVKVRAI